MKQPHTSFIIIFLIFLFVPVFTEKYAQIHQLQTLNLYSKQNHLASNLRTHDGMYASSNSIGGAIFGFLCGPILFFISFIFIWFNQKRAVIDYRRLKLAQQICQDVNPLRRDQISGAHMKLTHISGNSTTNQTIGDPLSNISMNGAIKITRSVQVMEWRATTQDRNGSRQTIYHLGWQSINVPNVEGRINPIQNWFVSNQVIFNPKVFVGEYLLADWQKTKCSKANQINPTMDNAIQIANRSNRNGLKPVIQDGYIFFPSSSGSISDHGSVRIKYSYCPIGPISLMAKTVQNTFEPFPIAQFQGNGKIEKNQLPACCCISNCVAQLLKPIQQIDLVQEQLLNRNQMIEGAVKKSKFYTIIIRVISYFLMVFGICIFFSPITTILGFIPLVGGFLKGTVGILIFVAAVIVCIPLFIIALSLAWLWYHPKVGAIILGVGLLILGVILVINYTRKGSPAQASQAAANVTHLLRSWSNFS